MSTALPQTIPLNLTRRIRCETKDNGNGQPNTDPLVCIASPNPTVATHAVDPNDNRVVVITPGTSAGSLNLVVNKTPGGSDLLSIPVTVTAAVNIGSVGFVEVVSPDLPKP